MGARWELFTSLAVRCLEWADRLAPPCFPLRVSDPLVVFVPIAARQWRLVTEAALGHAVGDHIGRHRSVFTEALSNGDGQQNAASRESLSASPTIYMRPHAKKVQPLVHFS